MVGVFNILDFVICFTVWWWHPGGWWGRHLCSGGGRSGSLYLYDNNRIINQCNTVRQTKNNRKNLDTIEQQRTFFQTLHKTSTLTDEIPHGADNFS